ncbi:MAG TPA: carbamoyl-phosphate synthase domain-containing protein, partial [Chthoniobacterales bacterium]
MFAPNMRALLALEDGRVFEGEPFGATGTRVGEICFNTSMIGYQEVLTDPSYRGQIVAMTYPHIGNYGTNALDQESREPHVRGFVIEELSEIPSSWRSERSLDEYLKRWNIPGIQ